MEYVRKIEMKEHSREEILPGYVPEFPYVATCAELDCYVGSAVPWHWHRSAELFYMKCGTLEYATPRGKMVFPEGSGGFINSNVLHTTRVVPSGRAAMELLHLFDPALLAGWPGSCMEAKYVLPLTASGVEMIPLYPENPAQREILEAIRDAFDLPEQAWGYEFRVREALSQIWLKLLAQAAPFAGQGGGDPDDKMKRLMVYIHEHLQEPVSVEQLARMVHVSRRACFRLFRETIRMTPVEYIRSVRLQKACRMLAEGDEPLTRIACDCGLGSSSYFSKVFRETVGCSPKEYRRRWHDHDKNGR